MTEEQGNALLAQGITIMQQNEDHTSGLLVLAAQSSDLQFQVSALFGALLVLLVVGIGVWFRP